MSLVTRLLAALALALAGSVVFATAASAHTANGGADCTSAHVDATSYDAGVANTYSLTVDATTDSGTFGAEVHRTLPVPQDGATHTWSYSIAAADGSFAFADSGQVGPCGPPVVDVCPDLPGDQPQGTSCTQPDDVVEAASTEAVDCDASEVVTTTTTTTTPSVFDQATMTWVPGTPVVTEATTTAPTEPGDCDTTEITDNCPGQPGFQSGACHHAHHQHTHHQHEVKPAHVTPQPQVAPVAQQPVVSAARVLPATGASQLAAGSTRTLGLGLMVGALGLLGGLVLWRRHTTRG